MSVYLRYKCDKTKDFQKIMKYHFGTGCWWLKKTDFKYFNGKSEPNKSWFTFEYEIILFTADCSPDYNYGKREIYKNSRKKNKIAPHQF